MHGNGECGRGGEWSGLLQVVVTKQGKVFKALFILLCGVGGRFNSFKVLSCFRLGAVWTRPSLRGDIRGPAELIPSVPPFPGDGTSFYRREKYTWSDAHSFRMS